MASILFFSPVERQKPTALNHYISLVAKVRAITNKIDAIAERQ